MSTNRLYSLLTILANTRCPTVFLNGDSCRKWELDEAPFHPAFELLSATHKADYLRAYLMYHHGGGYTDLKSTSKNWDPHFQSLNASDKWCLGYTEIGPHGVAPVAGALGDTLRSNYRDLIGCCAFIFKRKTPLARDWLARVDHVLSEKLELLQRNPAKHPQDRLGARFDDGRISEYPFAWTELLGDIFHPLIFEYRDFVLHADIAPSFQDYR
ncbi:MAG TPA: hypothetical protein VH278_11105 [Burkholderiaceae bacterium]|nr:hypothetical protein [Burkholderiaceae bacterium]